MGITRLGEKWRVSFISSEGKRRRLNFDTKRQAEEFNREVKIHKKLGANRTQTTTGFVVQAEAANRKTLKEAVLTYTETVTPTKSNDNVTNEKLYFSVMYDYLTDIFMDDRGTERLRYVDQVELLHLQKLQTYLLKEKQHNRCKDKNRCANHSEECRAHQLSASTVNRYFNCYRDFFRHCKLWRFTRVNEIAELENLAIQPKSRKIMQDIDIQRVLDEAPTWAAEPWFIMVAMGARPIELKRLRWSDVENRSIRFWSLKGNGTLRERWIPMPENVCEFFDRKRMDARKTFKAHPDNHVFATPNGGALNSKSLARMMAKITKKLGINGCVAYGFRHRFVTRGRKLGLDISTVGEMVGHSSFNTTMGYSHMESDDLRESINRVNQSAPILK